MDAGRRLCLRGLALFPLISLCRADGESAGGAEEQNIQVSRQGDTWVVEVRLVVPVPSAVAWEVLTDFDNMARIVGNLSSSKVVLRQGNVLQVEQRGRARLGLFSVAFESLREIVLTPRRRIQARGLAGNVKYFLSDLNLSTDPGGTLLTYRAEMVPDFWLPPLLGPSLLRHEMAEQFAALVAEMKRRGARE